MDSRSQSVPNADAEIVANLDLLLSYEIVADSEFVEALEDADILVPSADDSDVDPEALPAEESR